MEKLPTFLYGTAWKEQSTDELTTLALKQGFVGIDTANQAKHYQEALVGVALARAFASGVKRSSLFVQTKFTSLGGQDHRLPYDRQADLATQVSQSALSSLKHLQLDYLDSYLLHSPQNYPEWGNEDWQVWRAMEKLYELGITQSLGVSNINLQQLKTLMAGAKVKPRFVQNRCYARLGWDREVRDYCLAEGVVYQGFSLLTANLSTLQHPKVAELAAQHEMPIPQLIFSFAMEIGILPLTGTTQAEHMRVDLKARRGLLSATVIESLLAL